MAGGLASGSGRAARRAPGLAPRPRPMSVLSAIRPDRLSATLGKDDPRKNDQDSRPAFSTPGPTRRPSARFSTAARRATSRPSTCCEHQPPRALAGRPPRAPFQRRRRQSLRHLPRRACTSPLRTPKAWKPTGWARAPAPSRAWRACWRCWPGRAAMPAATPPHSRRGCGQRRLPHGCGTRISASSTPLLLFDRAGPTDLPAPGAPRRALAQGQ